MLRELLVVVDAERGRLRSRDGFSCVNSGIWPTSGTFTIKKWSAPSPASVEIAATSGSAPAVTALGRCWPGRVDDVVAADHQDIERVRVCVDPCEGAIGVDLLANLMPTGDVVAVGSADGVVRSRRNTGACRHQREALALSPRLWASSWNRDRSVGEAVVEARRMAKGPVRSSARLPLSERLSPNTNSAEKPAACAADPRAARSNRGRRAQKSYAKRICEPFGVSPGRVFTPQPLSAVMMPRGRHESEPPAGAWRTFTPGIDWSAIQRRPARRQAAELFGAVFLTPRHRWVRGAHAGRVGSPGRNNIVKSC